MQETIGMHELRPGERGVVKELCAVGSMRRRFLDIGLVKNAVVACVGRNPSGNLSAYRIRGAVIAIRRDDSCLITVQRKEGMAWD